MLAADESTGTMTKRLEA
ncbi:MAG: hypothetical protein ACJZ8F_04475 [Candidatus Pelagibacter sp.]